MPTWLLVGLEVARLTPEAIRLVRDIVAAIKDDGDNREAQKALRAALLGVASGKAGHAAASNAGPRGWRSTTGSQGQ